MVIPIRYFFGFLSNSILLDHMKRKKSVSFPKSFTPVIYFRYSKKFIDNSGDQIDQKLKTDNSYNIVFI